jgi:hypothetical protein
MKTIVEGQKGVSPNGREFDVYEAYSIELISWREAVEAVRKYNRRKKVITRKVIK